MPMTVPLRWADVVVRLGLTIVVGMLIGYNRREQGKAAGMRTTLLVCLAASIAMLQVNALLNLQGRPPSSFVMNDLMRLPLGILTGVGFIGGGAILRRGNVVVGVTTAATLWLVTVIGLCIGGGQIALGLAATAIGLFALWVLEWFEQRLRQRHASRLSLDLDAEGPSELQVRRILEDAGLHISAANIRLEPASQRRTLVFEVHALRANDVPETPDFIEHLAHCEGVRSLQWEGLA
jgi:putative Mg2+ transporter-C (MgtC) family protein